MIIGARFNGPVGSANGGYTAGLVAANASDLVTATGPGLVEVTLRVPPPLETEMTVEKIDSMVRILDGTRVVAEAAPTELADDLVPPVSLTEAERASAGYRGFATHPFPTCFVCGPKRVPDDGLRIFPGRLPDGRTAAPWVVPADVSPVLVWAALDCPGGWAVPQEERAYVLGRLAARIDALPRPGDTCVVLGQVTAEEGRKAHVLTTLYGPDGSLLAHARATWLALR